MGGFRQHLHNIEAWAKSADPRARLGLVELVPEVDERYPGASMRCAAVASGLGLSELELHYAICGWVGGSGRSVTQAVLAEALLKHEELTDASIRMARSQMRVEDWCAIVRADRYSLWPAVEALGAEGKFASRTLDQLNAEGRLTTVGLQGDPVMWTMPRARVTRSRRSIAVGALSGALGEDQNFAPAVSVADCSAALRWWKGPADRHVDGRTLLLATRFSFSGYWHWVMEGLQPLLRIDELGHQSCDRVLVFIGDAPPSFISESLEALGIHVPDLWLCSMPLDVSVEELVIPAHYKGAGGIVDMSTQMHDPWKEPAGRRLAEFVSSIRRRLDIRRDTTNARRRVLVSRRDAKRRRVSNEGALAEALSPLGFEEITLAHLSVREQISIFRAAEIVVGPHGAGFANLVFAQPGTRVIELHPEEMDRPVYRWLADAADLAYESVACPADPTSPTDMIVDVTRVTALLSNFKN